jgi:hypothetical protein
MEPKVFAYLDSLVRRRMLHPTHVVDADFFQDYRRRLIVSDRAKAMLWYYGTEESQYEVVALLEN